MSDTYIGPINISGYSGDFATVRTAAGSAVCDLDFGDSVVKVYEIMTTIAMGNVRKDAHGRWEAVAYVEDYVQLLGHSPTIEGAILKVLHAVHPKPVTVDADRLTEAACEKYARWEREKAAAREAAVANPNTWVQVSDIVEDAGDIGGDIQAGPAWSKRFVRWMPSIGAWAVINDSYYAAYDADQASAGDPVDITGIQRQTEYEFTFGNLDGSDDTEEWSNYVYETVCTEPRRTDYDAYARELAGDSQAVDYPDPAGRVPSWALS